MSQEIFAYALRCCACNTALQRSDYYYNISNIVWQKIKKTVSCTRVVVSSAADVPPLFFKATRGISPFAFTHMYDLHDVWLLVCSIWHMCPMPSRPQATTTTIRSLSNTLTFFDSVSARVMCVCDAFELWIRCHIYLFHDRATIKSETINIFNVECRHCAQQSRRWSPRLHRTKCI